MTSLCHFGEASVIVSLLASTLTTDDTLPGCLVRRYHHEGGCWRTRYGDLGHTLVSKGCSALSTRPSAGAAVSPDRGLLAGGSRPGLPGELQRIVTVRKMLGEESLATLEDEVAERFSSRGERLGVRVDDMPSTHDRQPFRFRRSDQLVIELKAYGVQRQQRDAHSGHDGLLDGLVARHLHDHPRGHLIRLHELVERGARARARLAHDESFAEQRPRRHPLGAREGMLDAGDQPVRVHRERLGPRGPVLGRPAHDGELNRALAHECHHFLAIAGSPQEDFDTRRSEERRVGKECRYRWSRCHLTTTE